MNHKWEEWLQTKLRPALKKDRLITVLLAGILILVIALPTGKKGAQREEKTIRAEPASDEIDAWTEEQGHEASMGEENYVMELEKRLRETLCAIDGIGDVKVMITLEESRELIFEKNQKKTQRQTEDVANKASTKSGKETTAEEVTVYRETGKEKEPVAVKQIYPKIEGVLVVAEGVGSGNLRSEITEAVQALFGIEAHKIKVLRMGHISSLAGIE